MRISDWSSDVCSSDLLRRRIMASRAQPSLWRESVKAGAARSGALFAAIGIALVTLAIALALATYHSGDAPLNPAAGGPTRNLLGVPGAWVGVLLLHIAGPLGARGVGSAAGRERGCGCG